MVNKNTEYILLCVELKCPGSALLKLLWCRNSRRRLTTTRQWLRTEHCLS